MRQFRPLLIVFGIALLLQSCATMEQTAVQNVSENKKQISPVLAATAPVRALKRKVAIARFTNETKYGQSFFFDENKDPLGKQAMDILSAKLAGTGKFILLERADIEKVNRELKMADLSNLNLSADYLIIGSVSEFGRKTVSDVGIFSRVKKQSAHAKVNVRLINVSTGEIIYSEEGQGEAFSEAGSVFGVGARADYDSSLNDSAISAAIAKLVDRLVENLLDKPWRAYILSSEGGSYIMSGGKSQGIRVGDIFCVYKRGDKVKNPQTNMMIELPGKAIAKVRVSALAGTDQNNEIAVCSLESGEIPHGNLTEVYVLESN